MSLLDTYQAERHPATARMLKHTMALGELQRRGDRMQALVEVVSELAEMDGPRKRLAGIASGHELRYDLGEGHPLLGRRMPDLDLVTAEGPLRVYELLHAHGRCCSTSAIRRRSRSARGPIACRW